MSLIFCLLARYCQLHFTPLYSLYAVPPVHWTHVCKRRIWRFFEKM